MFDAILFGPRDTDFISYRAWCALSHAIGSGDALCVEKISYELINTTMLGNFSAHIIVSVVGGLILAFPVLIHQGWAFVRPCPEIGGTQRPPEAWRLPYSLRWAWRLGTTSSPR